MKTKFKLFLSELSAISSMINTNYNSNKTVVNCLTASCQLKAIRSLGGNKVEKVCATYMLGTPNLTENIPLLFTVSWVMQVAKIKRVGWKKAIVEDTVVDAGLYALNYKELSKPIQWSTLRV